MLSTCYHNNIMNQIRVATETGHVNMSTQCHTYCNFHTHMYTESLMWSIGNIHLWPHEIERGQIKLELAHTSCQFLAGH